MEIKEWLLNKEDYKPPKDKDGFINKTIIAIIKILSRIKRDKTCGNGMLYKINPLIKLIFTVLFIIFLSMSRNLFYLYTIGTYFLLCLSTLDGDTLKKILGVSLIVPIFTVIILIPSIIMGNLYNSLVLILKVLITVVAVNLLSYTTKWHHITKSLKMLFIPDIFILVFDITIKYIYILGEFSLEMLYALKLRSIGKNNKKYTSISRVMGNLFFKSKTMGEEMYSAMECRGFTGEYVSYSKFKFTLLDLAYTSVNIFIIVLYFVLSK